MGDATVTGHTTQHTQPQPPNSLLMLLDMYTLEKVLCPIGVELNVMKLL